MPHIKLIQSGFENYTGHLAGYEFIDGVSEDNLPKRHADRISAVMRVEAIDDENYKGPTGDMIDKSTPAPVQEPSPRQTDEDKEKEKEQDAEKTPKIENPPFGKVYTLEELNEIADEKGMKGLREIADPAGVKNTSIAGLIREMMEFQEQAGF